MPAQRSPATICWLPPASRSRFLWIPCSIPEIPLVSPAVPARTGQTYPCWWTVRRLLPPAGSPPAFRWPHSPPLPHPSDCRHRKVPTDPSAFLPPPIPVWYPDWADKYRPYCYVPYQALRHHRFYPDSLQPYKSHNLL